MSNEGCVNQMVRSNNMDLITQLEELRYSDGALLYASDTEYWEYLGSNNMLDKCLEIVWKWLDQEGYIQ